MRPQSPNQLTTYKAAIKRPRSLVDPVTGELFIMDVVEQTVEKDCNWHKLWLSRLLLNLERIGNAKMRVACWVLENIDYSTNLMKASSREIAKALKVSPVTVVNTLKLLQAEDTPFLKLVNKQKSIYMVNPDMLFKGSSEARTGIIFEFKQVGAGTQQPLPFPDVATKDKVG